jgi:hypothetical protein
MLRTVCAPRSPLPRWRDGLDGYKAVAKAGAGTCKLKTGEPADFYWWDVYSAGDFSHQLMMVVVAKDAPDDEKKVALSILRQVAYTPKAKPHYKK